MEGHTDVVNNCLALVDMNYTISKPLIVSICHIYSHNKLVLTTIDGPIEIKQLHDQITPVTHVIAKNKSPLGHSSSFLCLSTAA